ncbi:MAG: type I-C CRISPR-associated endonuclease Cas1c [Negativibacillus sp.]
MKKLLNTLYVLTPESYLFCRNENVCIRIGENEKLCVPALTIDSIVCFGKMTVSTPLLEYCGEHGISVTFVSETGRFMGRFYGPVSGNVLLRKRQYESMQDEKFCRQLVQSILLAKLRNSKMVLMRASRSEKASVDKQKLLHGVEQLSQAVENLLLCEDIDSMRGVEGAAATVYFARFDDMLNGNPGGFRFESRSRRPPRNEVNAALSFTYMLLTSLTQSAMETVGLDPAAGYLHTLRPGRASFALDLVEELRAPLCDRFVLSLFNKGQLSSADFDRDEEAVLLNERGRRTLLSNWQRRKQEIILHPFLGEKVQIGMIPYVQAMLFARVLRGDLDEYPPFVWR